MITSTSGIYGEIFRLLAFVIEELDKIQLGPSFGPLYKVFKFFSNLQLCLQVQVLQALKVSFHSDEVDVNFGTLSKESLLWGQNFTRCSFQCHPYTLLSKQSCTDLCQLLTFIENISPRFSKTGRFENSRGGKYISHQALKG